MHSDEEVQIEEESVFPLDKPFTSEAWPMDLLRDYAKSVGAKTARSKTALIENIVEQTEGEIPVILVPAVDTVSIRVKKSCPYDMLQAAGLHWSRTPIDVRADAAFLPELRANPYLEVT